MYDKQIQDIVQGWKDVVELTDATYTGNKPNLLEQRFFGEDIADRPDAIAHVDRKWALLRMARQSLLQ